MAYQRHCAFTASIESVLLSFVDVISTGYCRWNTTKYDDHDVRVPHNTTDNHSHDARCSRDTAPSDYHDAILCSRDTATNDEKVAPRDSHYTQATWNTTGWLWACFAAWVAIRVLGNCFRRCRLSKRHLSNAGNSYRIITLNLKVKTKITVHHLARRTWGTSIFGKCMGRAAGMYVRTMGRCVT